MINWKTILSSFDDKPTLLQWLKIVEKALQNASLESVTAKPTQNGAYVFEFKFADGSTVTSTPVDLKAKGIEGIEEVSDEIVGNQTITTLRAYYTDGTTDEFPVYAENGKNAALYSHTIFGALDTDNQNFSIQFLSHDNTKVTSPAEFIKFFQKNKCYFSTIDSINIFYSIVVIENKVSIRGRKLTNGDVVSGFLVSILNDLVVPV